MNKRIKDAYDTINMTKDTENRIINNCINSKKIIRRKRLVWAVSIICLFLFLGISVNAKNIEKFWVRVFNMGAIEDMDGERHQLYEEVSGVKFNILDDMPIGKEFVSTVDEVQNMFGIKLLKYDNATSNEIRYEGLKNYQTGIIDRLYLRQLDFYVPDIYGWNEKVGGPNGFSLSMQMVSDMANETTIRDYLLELNTMMGKNVLEEYYSDNLQTKVIIYEYEYDYRLNGFYSLNAIFVYKNIRYVVDGFFDTEPPIDKLKEIIEELHE